MYKSEFDKQFNNNKNYNAYMFYGVSDFLIESYSLKVAKKLANGDDIIKVYFDEYNFDNCYDTLTQSSLFASSNILLIKITKKLPKKEVDKLILACKLNNTAKVIFACLGETDYKTMAKSFSTKTESVEVRFFAPYDNEAINILGGIARESGVQTDSNTLMFLYNMHQKNLSLCVSDISKLSILNEVVTSKTINNHCFGLGSVDIEEFLIKLFSKQNINKDLYFILEEGINEIQLITRISGFIQQLYMINTYLKLHGNLNIKEIWGYPLPKNIANTQASLATKYKKEDFLYMLNFLQDLELELKSSKIDDTNAYVQAKLRNFLK